jgi:PAS domain S-box-containing protein
MGIKSLKHSLAFTFVFTAIVPIVIVSILVLNHLSVDNIGEIQKKNLLLARAISGQVEGFLREPLTVMHNVGAMLKANPDYSESEIRQVLDLHVSGSQFFESIYILDDKGIVQSVGLAPDKQDFEKEVIGIDLAHKELYRSVRQTGQPTWSDTFLSLVSGQMSLALGVSLDGRTLVGNCSIEFLASLVQRANVESKLMTIIVDRGGAIIVHPDRIIAARQVNISNLLPVQQGFAGKEGTYQYLFDNVEYIGSVSLIPGPGWLVLVSQTKADAYGHITHTAIYFLLGVLGAILLAVFFTLAKARSFSKPLSEFADRAKIIANGDYDIELGAPSYLEEKDLAESFQKMTHAVRDRERALLESEGRFREIFNGVDEAILIYDSATGKIMEVNQTMIDMYGYSYDEALKLTAGDLSAGEAPYAKNDALAILKKTIAEGPQLFEWMARRKDGKLFWVEVALQSTTIGGKGRLLGVIRDISERKRLEGELFQAQKMEALGTLAGGIAHDFNNILGAVVGYTELVKMHVKDDPKVFGYLDGVLQAAMRAGDLVKQILTFSRGTEQQKIPLQISSIIKETLKMLRSSIPATIEIKQNIQSQGIVLAEPTQIHQIIMNLCTNAYHAMQETGGILGISLKDVEVTGKGLPGVEIEQGGYLLLEVSDTGHGMDEETKNKIFEPYFTTKEPGKGTGLGLAVVHGIVKSHNGSISLYSEPGHGTTFHVYLPKVLTDEKVLVSEDDKEPLVGGDESIMLVDDEKDIVTYAKDALEKFGYKVEPFSNAVQAFQEFQMHPEQFDMVITDMTMPYMTGTELAQKLIEIKPDIPIILCTGYSELVHKEKAYAMGIAGYLEKPVIMEDLIRVVRKVLSEKSPGKQIKEV